MNKVKGILLLVGVALLVFFITRAVYEPEHTADEVSSTVLLERIRPVLKLVTVEGDFSEVYNETITDANYSWFKGLSPFEKQVFLRVNARMSIGYDLEGMNINVDEQSKVVTLSGTMTPEILSTEYTFDYYDLKEGLFTEFTGKDISRIEMKAKALITSAAAKSGLFNEAAKRRAEAISVTRTLVESSGWTFVDASGESTPVKG